MPLAKVVVTYDLKKSCGESVRVKATAVENSAVPVVGVGDYYVPRSIMDALGLKDTDPVKVTFEKA